MLVSLRPSFRYHFMDSLFVSVTMVTVVWRSSWSLCWPLSWRATRGSGRPLTDSSRKWATSCPRKSSTPSVLSRGPTWGFMSAKTLSRSRKFWSMCSQLKDICLKSQKAAKNFLSDMQQSWTFFKHRSIEIFWTGLISSFLHFYKYLFSFQFEKFHERTRYLSYCIKNKNKIIPAWTPWRYIENQPFEATGIGCREMWYTFFCCMDEGTITGNCEYFLQIVSTTRIDCGAVWSCGCQSDSGAGWRTAGTIRGLLSHSWRVPQVHHATQPHLRIPKVLPWPQIFPKLHLS